MDGIYSNLLELLKYLQNELDHIDQLIESGDPVRKELYRASVLSTSDRFDQITNHNGKTDLVPARQKLFLYRGQHEDWENCNSALYRDHKPNDDSGFVSILKTYELEIVLSKHPAVKDLVNTGYNINFEGLAQHYGLATNLIDFTSDHHVAAFFGCTNYESGKYFPVESDFGKTGYGELYKINTAALWEKHGGKFIPLFEPIGLQVFSRPELQKAYGVKGVKKNSATKRYIFKHDFKASKKIFDLFEGGNSLFPPDPLAKKVKEIKDSNTFSLNSIILLKDRRP
ncbi:MAG: FRG domain-containing protein, partial [Candidatus Paceibacterota bacterium]